MSRKQPSPKPQGMKKPPAPPAPPRLIRDYRLSILAAAMAGGRPCPRVVLEVSRDHSEGQASCVGGHGLPDPPDWYGAWLDLTRRDQ